MMSIAFKDAEEGQCRFFITTATDENAPVCGDPVVAGKSYCAHHRVMVFRLKPEAATTRQIAGRMTDDDFEDEDADHEPDLTEVFA